MTGAATAPGSAGTRRTSTSRSSFCGSSRPTPQQPPRRFPTGGGRKSRRPHWDVGQRWHNGEIDDEQFFRNLPGLGKKIKELHADQAKDTAAKAAAQEATADVEKEWKSKTLAQKRELIKKAPHAVIALPSGMGNKPFDVDQVIPAWKQSGGSVALPG
ncbi:hypothetical protein ACFY00_05725 [Kitasatospora sp. NPDC001540]|uniref:hypothetical protein n=1 Tax=Kitasatospora sp. NPDC001540 TaxID=3364014 RepID=UPI0036C5877A